MTRRYHAWYRITDSLFAPFGDVVKVAFVVGERPVPRSAHALVGGDLFAVDPLREPRHVGGIVGREKLGVHRAKAPAVSADRHLAERGARLPRGGRGRAHQHPPERDLSALAWPATGPFP